MLNHPIVEQSFAIIDREVGKHQFSVEEYAIAQRIIHTTADFEYLHLLQISPDAITSAVKALQSGCPIVTDVNMVKQGIKTMVSKTFNNPIIVAVDSVTSALPGKTRTETGLLHCLTTYPQAIYVFGNAPTALLAFCKQYPNLNPKPPLVIGAPVGFVSVLESKQALAHIPIPQIRITGRKGGSPVAAAIINALLVFSYHQKQEK
jgi:precorrin-8X/cobalt-precorrin-8 methylmutase